MSMPASDLTRGAVTGLKVVDLSRVLAGPLCTQMLADHGADVVKIEPPAGDETRGLGPPFDAAGQAAYFSAVNRGKRGMALDLSRANGRAVLEALLEGADVLVENFLPGTMERWGLGYEAHLSERFPRLIYCAISGFGADGPLGGLPGYDAVLQAMCGLMSINGAQESGATRVGVPIVDYVTGYNALTGVLLALAARERTGRGQRVEVTLFDTALGLLVPHAANWLCSGNTPGRLGSAHPNIAPYDKFAAADGEIFLGILNDGQFRRFCQKVARVDLLDDPRFRTNADRLAHVAALRTELERTLAKFTSEALCRDLMQAGVPAGAVNTVPQAFAQAHVAHRDMLVESEGHRAPGVPVKLARTPGGAGRRPPRFGEHARDILADAGFDERTINGLIETGIVSPQRKDTAQR
ncbi:crotonobetainyl-CoA:carnitine CoA-transferase CaiB-like acyl-CoA transferase [Bradyrhizobium stylosanthis]|uniref:Crotonobetainyl-CoA:carnitine CoA-transferase CaiB-like acyl-CoA transferase n=2 Tax=Bradyrhizobium stylosanthis TaxID=1803665 RepID=A0A560ED03_9BRAD|nr:crotonobetainyl-CoA:carnitine CoA-transferase CaiB-like acyl-CoA transferase [Bradyrhizobium stylosanthis]